MVKINIDKENMLLTISENYNNNNKKKFISTEVFSTIDISKMVKCSIEINNNNNQFFVNIYFNGYKDSLMFDNITECKDNYNKISNFMINRNKIKV